MRSTRLDGQVVLVTGATQGLARRSRVMLPRSAPRACASPGAMPRAARRSRASITASGCPTLFVAAELGDEAQVRGVFAKAVAKFGRVDGLVNSGALTDRGTIENTSVELWDRLFAVNARAPFILTQEFVRHAKARGGGGSIVTSSRAPRMAGSRS